MTVTYEHPGSGTSHTEQDTTDAQGHFETSFVGNRAGNWFITPRYAGTDQYQPTEGEACVINSG